MIVPLLPKLMLHTGTSRTLAGKIGECVIVDRYLAMYACTCIIDFFMIYTAL